MSKYAGMVLSEAFMERNDLKKKISFLTEQASTNIVMEEEVYDRTPFNNSSKMEPTDAMEKALNFMTDLWELNIAIAEANIENASILKSIETLSAKINFLAGLLTTVSSTSVIKRTTRYTENDPEFIKYRTLIDADKLKLMIDDYEKTKRSFEKALARNNATITLK